MTPVCAPAAFRRNGSHVHAGSGDKTIKQWSGNMAHSQYMGHTDSVRALCLLPDVGFVSASHDASLRIWSFQGEQLGQLLGHSSLVYCCAASPAGLIASGTLYTHISGPPLSACLPPC